MHVSVMPREVIDLLSPSVGETWVDATTGVGGHSQLLLEKIGPKGRLICLDRDETMLRLARERLKGNASFWQASFDRVGVVLEELGVRSIDGLFADLGVCSNQLDDPQRGLSFQQDGPLDMRLNPEEGETAAELLARLPEWEMADLFWRFGEERFSRRIARKIAEMRKSTALETTEQLANLVRSCVPREKKRNSEIDQATRVFQALRIAVNNELEALKTLLEIAALCIGPGGRCGVISFHSLEDRLVKQAFRRKEVWEELTRKPMRATAEEVKSNPRARSAKFRVAKRIEKG